MLIRFFASPRGRWPAPTSGGDDPDNGESAAQEALCRLIGPESRGFLSGVTAEETSYYDVFGEEPGDR